MSVGRVFSRAFGTIGRNPIVVVGLALLMGAIPTLALTFAAVQLFPTAGIGGRLIINGWVSILVGALVQGTLTRASVADAEGRRASFAECLVTGLRSLPWLLGLAILIGLGVGLGTLLLVIPGLVLMTMWFVALPALAEERESILDAISRSTDLTQGARWKIFGIFLIVTILNALIGGIFGLIVASAHLEMFSPLTGRAELTVVSGGTAMFLQTIALAFWGTIQPSVYVELRDWKEGGSAEALEQVFA
jgi:hypothetical protein